MGQNFSWQKNWSQTWATTRRKTTTSRKPLKCSSKILSWKRMYLLFASRSKAKTKPQKTYFCQLIHKNCMNWGKNLDRYWTTRLFAHRLSSVKTTEYSSSSWWSTSRRRWSDWILEVKGVSSEPFCAISTFVEEYNGKEAEATRKDFNLVLTHQDKKFFNSELFEGTQDVISLIFHYRTTY